MFVTTSNESFIEFYHFHLCRIVLTLECFLELEELFKVIPQHLNRIKGRTLTRPLQSPHFVFLQTFRGGNCGVHWMIVLLQNQSLLELK